MRLTQPWLIFGHPTSCIRIDFVVLITIHSDSSRSRLKVHGGVLKSILTAVIMLIYGGTEATAQVP